MKHRAHYDTLGVKPEASPDEIKKAFRAKAKKCHPDHHPGDAEKESEFKSLSIAYGVLSDPDARRHYDENGEAPPINDLLSEAYGLIIQGFQAVKAKEGDNIFYVDVFKLMLQFIAEAQADFEQKIVKLEQQNKRNNKLIKKIVYKNGGSESFLHMALSEENRKNEVVIAQWKHGIEAMKKAHEVVSDFQFDVERKQENVFDHRRGFGVDFAFDPYTFVRSTIFGTETKP